MLVAVCLSVCAVSEEESRQSVSDAPDRGLRVPLRSAAAAQDPRVECRTEPMCVWHSLGAIHVLVRPPSLQSTVQQHRAELLLLLNRREQRIYRGNKLILKNNWFVGFD